MPLGAILGAGASLIGGLLGRSAQEDANTKNARLQKEFAQNSIRWKVEDAKAAGIHPIYALGAPTYSASPSYVGDTALPTAMANMGQDISRAVDAARTPGERVGAYEKTVQDLNIQRMGLENEILASQLRKVYQPGHALPMAGDGVDVVGNPRVENLVAGVPWNTNPHMSDANVFEQRYGDAEVLQTLLALGIGGADLGWNIKRKADAYTGPKTSNRFVDWFVKSRGW